MFQFLGTSHSYFVHPYHRTWTAERAVEIPIALQCLNGARKGARVLEVGNVLAHYPQGRERIRRFEYTVVDKFEKAPGVVNVDVLDFTPQKPFDLILTISTLEHIGLDEGGEPTGWRVAVARLVGLLAKGGRLLVTMPIGYNWDVDQYLREERLPFDEVHYLKRISTDNLWRETGLSEVKWTRYNFPHRGGNAIMIGFLTAPP